MYSSGWGVNFLTINKALAYAMKQSHQPVQMYNKKGFWNYAANKYGTHPVCQQKGMGCYFLNISSCEPIPEECKSSLLTGHKFRADKHYEGSWLYEYASRLQTWLRWEIYNYTSLYEPMITPCTVMHVRRSDVVKDNTRKRKRPRKYYPISKYINATYNMKVSKNILLLTDDQNAIEEALLEFPEYNWIYLNRKRFRGDEGEWQDHFPSGDPKQEVIIILSIFRLVRHCNTLIHGRSGFSYYLKYEMEKEKENLQIIDLDKVK